MIIKQFSSPSATRAALAASATLAFAGVCASSAGATTVLGNGTALPPGTSVGGAVTGNATLNLTPSPQSATCTQGDFAATVGTNPMAPSVAVTPTALNLSACTDTIAGINFTKVELITDPTLTGSVTTNGGGTGGAWTLQSPRLRVSITGGGLPGVCVFTINNATGTASAVSANNAAGGPSSLTFIAVPITSPGSFCSAMSPASLTVRFSPLTVLTPGGSFGEKVTLG